MLTRMRKALDRWLHPRVDIQVDLVDEQRWVDISDGTPKALNHLLGVYFEQMQENLSRLKEAISHHDAMAVQMTAHGARGSSLNFGMIGMVAPLLALERMGEAKDLAAAGPQLALAYKLFRSIRDQWVSYQKIHSLAA